ncbi:MAG: hypothetical protein WAZ94_00995 [Phycisphaerales bacterium]
MKESAYIAAILAFGFTCRASAQPMTTAFTYQGELRNSGTPATGPHDLRFRLYDAAAGGVQVGPTLCSDNVSMADGRFTVELDFGSQFAGQLRFLEIELRADTGLNCTDAGGFVTLAPRQPLTGTPNALFALNAATASTAASATNAGQLNGQSAAYYQNAANLSTGTVPDARLSGMYSGLLTLSNAGNAITGVFTGSGAALTGLNASNIANGTVGDARLTANVALLNTNQTFTGEKTFLAVPAFTAAGTPFTVSSSTLVTNLNADRLDGLDSTAFLQSVPTPLTLSGSNTSHIILGQNTSGELGSSAVRGYCSAASGLHFGVIGVNDSTAGRGVAGQATSTTGAAYGVQGASASTDGRGVYGIATAATGSIFGGYFETPSTAGTGVRGLASAASGTTYGVWGQSSGTSGVGVLGEATATTGSTYGGRFEGDSTSGIGVFGYATATSGSTYGGVFQSASTGGIGGFGYASAASGTTYGLWGQSSSPSGFGVFGEQSSTTGPRDDRCRAALRFAPVGPAAGCGRARTLIECGTSTGERSAGRGVYGLATAGSGTTYGGYFESISADGRGVYGLATNFSGNGVGGYFQSASLYGRGVEGIATNAGGVTFGGRFESSSSSGRGVYALATSGGGTTYGVLGESRSVYGFGVYGIATADLSANVPYGVAGQCSTASSGYAVYAFGDSGASGTKSFRIDHPIDPENKYLLHYSAESPEVINFYRGTVMLDGAGEAVVELPAYFAGINKSPSYQLTAVGAPMPMLHVAEEISEESLKAGERAGPGVAPPICSFRIAGGVRGAKVSWEVKALRNDLRMRLHGAPVQRDKTGPERGKYQHPGYYGQPAELGVDFHED